MGLKQNKIKYGNSGQNKVSENNLLHSEGEVEEGWLEGFVEGAQIAKNIIWGN